jgi:hypothetical protein
MIRYIYNWLLSSKNYTEMKRTILSVLVILTLVSCGDATEITSPDKPISSKQKSNKTVKTGPTWKEMFTKDEFGDTIFNKVKYVTVFKGEVTNSVAGTRALIASVMYNKADTCLWFAFSNKSGMKESLPHMKQFPVKVKNGSGEITQLQGFAMQNFAKIEGIEGIIKKSKGPVKISIDLTNGGFKNYENRYTFAFDNKNLPY